MRASDFITEQPVPPKKPGTIAVTNMPVYNKNISMKDQQMQKFKQQMQKDSGYQYTSQATKDAIKQSDKRVRDAMRKQARVDAIGGAGASTIQRVKPVKFDPKNSVSNAKIAMDDIQNAIREHVKQGIPFTECMFRAGSPAFTEFYRQVRAVREHLNLDWQDQELLDTDIGECIMVEGELVPLDVPMEELELNEESGKEMFAYFQKMHTHEPDNNTEMKQFMLSHNWELRNFTPDMFPSEEEFFDYDDPFDRLIDIDYSYRVDLSQPIIVGPQYADGKYSVIDGNHRAAAAQQMGKTIKGYFPVKQVNEAEYQGRKVKLNSPKRGGPKKFYVYVKNPKTGRVKKISWGDTTGLSVKAKDRGAVRSFVARHGPLADPHRALHRDRTFRGRRTLRRRKPRSDP